MWLPTMLVFGCGGDPDCAEDEKVLAFEDADGDGFGDPSLGRYLCQAPAGTAQRGGDCDDADATVNPDAAEVCDGRDQDCSGVADDGLPEYRIYDDLDGDGFGATASGRVGCEAPGEDTTETPGDCDDLASAVYPGAAEVCDGVDQDCDGVADDGLPTAPWWVDADGDGFGGGAPTQACAAPGTAWVQVAGDCDDLDALVFPGATEVCNEVDDDCDGLADEDDPGLDPTTRGDWYVDADGDGYGRDASLVRSCVAPPGAASTGGDCNDAVAAVNPGATEVCGGVDEDCDGLADDLDPSVDPASLTTWYLDADGDGLGDPANPTSACVAPDDTVTLGTDCDDTDPQVREARRWAPDLDGDGAIDVSVAPVGPQCVAPAGYIDAASPGDCDDTDPAISPSSQEVCDGGIDNDCDGLADETDPSTVDLVRTWPDLDGDGYGALGQQHDVCVPAPSDVLRGGDCDDGDPLRNPDAAEVCNEIDDDCDGLVDDGDPTLDPGTTTRWYLDADGDGRGDPAASSNRCAPPPAGVLDDSDCDDSDASVFPGAAEVCNGQDDDCDTLVDDLDPDVDPATQQALFADLDADGFGDAAAPVLACDALPGIASADDLDCDDTDPLATVDQAWSLDADGDGAGDGAQLAFQCANPGGGLAPEALGVDCDDADPDRAPHLPEVCNDGIDNDCDGVDDVCAMATCRAWLDLDPSLSSGVYTISPAGTEQQVYCDMETDGGGWTLVASTQVIPLRDQAGPWHVDLTTLDPAAVHQSVWTGLRAVALPRADMRFACHEVAGASAMTVDLSFYDVPWYGEITTGTDAQSCFSDPSNPSPPVERRDNLTGLTLPATDPWNTGALEGEDNCSDSSDFTVDFDDRGMDSNQSDGTDWGEDDGSAKCGISGVTNGQWFLFVRER